MFAELPRVTETVVVLPNPYQASLVTQVNFHHHCHEYHEEQHHHCHHHRHHHRHHHCHKHHHHHRYKSQLSAI